MAESQALTPNWGDPHCFRCQGRGYVVQSRGQQAFASRCECVPECPRCEGRGRIWVRREDGERLARCRCQMLPDRMELFNRCRLPARHAQGTFQSFDPERPGARAAYSMVTRWLKSYHPEEDHRGLVLYGDVGRGKTHLVVALARALVFGWGASVRFIEFSQLLSDLKHGFELGHGSAGTLQALVSVPILIIDELGKGRNTDFERSVVDELISGRYNGLKTTIATTNYAPGTTSGTPNNLAMPHTESLADRVGLRVFSRLQEMADFWPALGEDYRSLPRHPGKA